jgi:hypothetical protein
MPSKQSCLFVVACCHAGPPRNRKSPWTSTRLMLLGRLDTRTGTPPHFCNESHGRVMIPRHPLAGPPHAGRPKHRSRSKEAPSLRPGRWPQSAEGGTPDFCPVRRRADGVRCSCATASQSSFGDEREMIRKFGRSASARRGQGCACGPSTGRSHAGLPHHRQLGKTEAHRIL